MFAAVIIACAVQNGVATNDCREIADRWGPYVSEQKCEIRLDQMNDWLTVEKGFDSLFPVGTEVQFVMICRKLDDEAVT